VIRIADTAVQIEVIVEMDRVDRIVFDDLAHRRQDMAHDPRFAGIQKQRVCAVLALHLEHEMRIFPCEIVRGQRTQVGGLAQPGR